MRKPLAYFTATAALLAPALLLASDILLLLFMSEPGLAAQRVALGVFAVAIVGVAVLSHDRAQWQITGGAALAILGAIAIVIRPGFLVAPTRPPAVLFPLAQMSGVPAALIGADIIFLTAFSTLAMMIRVASRPDETSPRRAALDSRRT